MTNNEEVFAEVYGYDTLYEISNLGRLRTKRWGKQGYRKEYKYIEPRLNSSGYLCVNLRKNRKQRTVFIHRLVADAFVENPKGYSEVNHLDENKENCVASNLEWCSHLQNCNYGTRNEKTRLKSCKAILCKETGIVYQSGAEAAEKLGISKTAISNCVSGRSKTCMGYTWEKVNV